MKRVPCLPTRRLAAAAWHRRITDQRRAFASLRPPEPNEVPLSPAEVAFGFERGLIRAPIHNDERS